MFRDERDVVAPRSVSPDSFSFKAFFRVVMSSLSSSEMRLSRVWHACSKAGRGSSLRLPRWFAFAVPDRLDASRAVDATDSLAFETQGAEQKGDVRKRSLAFGTRTREVLQEREVGLIDPACSLCGSAIGTTSSAQTTLAG